MSNSLPVSRLVRVAVDLTPAAAQAQDLSTLLILGSTAVIDTVERFRAYESIAAVAGDFGTSAPEYLTALLYFSQRPQPARLKVGRWVKTAAAGLLRGAPLSASQQQLNNFTAITSGGFTYTRDANSPTNVTGINLSGATNLNAVASIITAALTGAVMVWNANFQRFELTSTLTGATSSISFLTAPGSGTNIAGLLGMTESSPGAYRAPGQVAESAVAAASLFDANYGQQWYALMMLGASDAEHLAVAAYIEATNTKHIYGVSTQDAGTLVAATDSDVASALRQAGYNKTLVQFSSSSPYAVASLLGRAITINYGGNNTVITLAFKQQPGIVAENLTSTQADALKAKRCNAFLSFQNDTNIILNGVVSSGEFIDTITGTDALAVEVQSALYNLLYTSRTKIPQTDAGMHLMVTTVEDVMGRYVTNGLLAPGVWNSGGFGTLEQGDFLQKGFYVFAPRVSTQSVEDRAARKSVPIQVAAKLAGAVHEVSIAVSVNQ